MERAGYLRRIWLGRGRRARIEAVEEWEASYFFNAPVIRSTDTPGMAATVL